jgi:hypothetical protein
MQTPSSGSVPFGQSAASAGSVEDEEDGEVADRDESEVAGVGLAPTRTASGEPRNATASAARSAATIPAFTSGGTPHTTSL